MKQEYIRKLKTEDGYTFYLLNDGTVVDNLDADNVDMAFDTLEQFTKEMIEDSEVNLTNHIEWAKTQKPYSYTELSIWLEYIHSNGFYLTSEMLGDVVEKFGAGPYDMAQVCEFLGY